MTDTIAAAFAIAGRPIGPGHPVYIIAVLSANHGPDELVAIDVVRAAAAAGADAVKLQTYTPDTITIDSDAPPFRTGSESLWSGSTLYELYREGTMPWEWQPRLKTLAESLGMDCFASPFDATAVDFLVGMDVPAFKVASFELVDLPLIRKMASTGRPLIMSTGMATEAEIDEAIAAARTGGATEIALLKCTSAYPSQPEDVNLRAIDAMASRWGLPVGLSDHTIGTTVPVAAVALGACIVEKHMTLSAADTTLDDRFRGREPTVPAFAVRRGGHRSGRATHRTQHSLDPAGRRAAHPTLRGGPGSSRRSTDPARNPVGLRVAGRSGGSADRLEGVDRGGRPGRRRRAGSEAPRRMPRAAPRHQRPSVRRTCCGSR